MGTESTRRRMLGAAGIGALATLVATRGEARASHLASQVSGSSDNAEPAVQGTNSSDGPGVRGDSAAGYGVEGQTDSNSYSGVFGSNANTGFNAAGVRGFVLEHGMGVDGQSVNGVGVSGTSQEGIGVRAGSLNGVAFQAFAPGGEAAIRVGGKARFSHLGSGTIPAHERSSFVPFFGVTASAHIMVTLTSDPGGVVVEWVERVTGAPTGFRIHLTGRAKRDTTFSYFIAYPFFG